MEQEFESRPLARGEAIAAPTRLTPIGEMRVFVDEAWREVGGTVIGGAPRWSLWQRMVWRIACWLAPGTFKPRR